MPSLVDRLALAREGSAVERCHVHPHLQRYSVGHHSLDLITLITLCWQADHEGRLPSSTLLAQAAFHDIPERLTGDIPSPTKDLLGERLAVVEDRVFAWLGLGLRGDEPVLTQEEHRYLELGDRLELYLWCLEERARGNTTISHWIDGLLKMLRSIELPPSYSEIVLFADLRQSNGVRPHFLQTDTLLKEFIRG